MVRFGVRAPDRAEIVGDLLLQRRDGGRDIRVGQHGALVMTEFEWWEFVRGWFAAYGLSPGKQIRRTRSFKVA